MKLSELNPTESLKKYLVDNGFSYTVYSMNEKPTSEVPDYFVDLLENGTIRRLSTDKRLYESTIAVTINTKLLSKGELNSKKQEIILKDIEDLLEESDRFALSTNTVFSGKNIASGYSYKTINVITKIY